MSSGHTTESNIACWTKTYVRGECGKARWAACVLNSVAITRGGGVKLSRPPALRDHSHTSPAAACLCYLFQTHNTQHLCVRASTRADEASRGARARSGRGELRRYHAPRRSTAKGGRALPERRRGRPVSCCKQRGSCTYERWLQGGATARLVAAAAAGAGNCATSLPHSRASVTLLTHDIRSRPGLPRPMPALRPSTPHMKPPTPPTSSNSPRQNSLSPPPATMRPLGPDPSARGFPRRLPSR